MMITKRSVGTKGSLELESAIVLLFYRRALNPKSQSMMSIESYGSVEYVELLSSEQKRAQQILESTNKIEHGTKKHGTRNLDFFGLQEVWIK